MAKLALLNATGPALHFLKIARLLVALSYPVQTTLAALLPLTALPANAAAPLGAASQSAHPQGQSSPQSTAPGGPLDNNVDLPSGKVSFNVPLADLDDGVSPPVDLSLNYNSNTLPNYKIWNVEAPTNDSGVGFSLSMRHKIIRYTNETGNTNDDTYYLASDDSTNELDFLRLETENTEVYQQKGLKSNTLIRYFPSSDLNVKSRWEITEDNGQTSTAEQLVWSGSGRPSPIQRQRARRFLAYAGKSTDPTTPIRQRSIRQWIVKRDRSNMALLGAIGSGRVRTRQISRI